MNDGIKRKHYFKKIDKKLQIEVKNEYIPAQETLFAIKKDLIIYLVKQGLQASRSLTNRNENYEKDGEFSRIYLFERTPELKLILKEYYENVKMK